MTGTGLATATDSLERRVLLRAPTKKDSEVTGRLLAKVGLECVPCVNLNHLIHELERGAGTLLFTEEATFDCDIQCLLDRLAVQPAWSDLPVIFMVRGGTQSPAAKRVFEALRNVTLLERPAPMRSVISVVQAAIRARERQYQIREQFLEIADAEARSSELREQLQFLLESERAARQEAERVSRMKDEFLATLSHELRTPLNAIFGWTQLLKLTRNDPVTMTEGIDVIDRNVRIQNQLIEDLLDMSRIISGKVRLNVQRIELAGVINAAIEGLRPALGAKGIKLKKEFDSSNCTVNGDPGRLQQVIWNLLTNAIKFTPEGGQIDIRTQRVDSHLELSVQDNGAGISVEFLPHLFERFSQADGSIKRKHGGLGLGLSIVKNLVELHGGTVSAESLGEGQGATFLMEIPLHAPNEMDHDISTLQVSTPRLAGDGEPLALRGVRVLIVDDEPDARELVKRYLVEYEAIPKLAASAFEAQEMFASFRPDVIVSDIGMPGQDGYEFMQSIRRQGIKTPAIALTAFARAEDRIRSIQAGYQTHLPKPIEPAELLAVIASLSERGREKP
ncbi:MAG: sensor hybrid histidine kinase [Planctomycetaceae bacterium]|nr:sensor hybrid histidine kinase [Planctomycetaceae bacterium]